MYGFIAGITDTDDINFCPRCGKEVYDYNGDGIARCAECGFRFGVVECENVGVGKKQERIGSYE